MRLIEVVAQEGHSGTLTGIAEQHEAADIWWGAPAEDGRRTCRMLVADEHRQEVMDSLQSALGGSPDTRILVLSVDTVLPRPEDTGSDNTASTREELYAEIERGARADLNFLLLVILSTVVATVGLVDDNVAVVIGAMVIAPLLGPNIAFSFATALGDRPLLWRALKTNLLGLALAFAISLGIGLAWPVTVTSAEIVSRTDVGLASVALALASGAAAVLSLTTGLSSALVGVMVAVALLPPTATFGLLVGSGELEFASGAALLLAINVVCVALAANTVFMLKGVRPRTWLERRRARQSWTLFGLLWLALLAVLMLVILFRDSVTA